MTVNLNANVTIAKLFANQGLGDDVMDTIKKYSEGGFTKTELDKLKKMGVDTNIILENSTEEAKVENTKTDKTGDDVSKKASELKEKYTKGLKKPSGDPYKSNNPKLKALKEALDDGFIKTLADEGYTKDQIIEIVSKAFSGVGISGAGNGGYSLPMGHDEEAKKIYEQFKNQLANATGPDSAEIKAQKEKIATLNRQIRENNFKLRNLEFQITVVQDEIQESLDKAIEDSKKIQEEQKTEAKAIVNQKLNEYANSGGEMTYEEFQNGLAGALDELAGEANSALSQVISNMVQAERKMSVLNSYLTNMKTINDANLKLGDEVKQAVIDLGDLEKEQLNCPAEDSSCSRTDPIGFTSDGTRYDLFIDDDNNGKITNENEFLGSKNGFSEMKALDADNDGKVTQAELAQSNVKIVVTNKDGSQSIKEAREVFGENDSIDLNSYNQMHKEMSNGNALMGTFDVNFGGQKAEGYQTLDTLDWLDENFEFSDEDEGIGRFATDESTAEEVEDYSDKYNAHMTDFERMRNDMNDTWAKLGIASDEISTKISEASERESQNKANRIEEGFKQKAAKAAADEAQEAKEAEAKEAEEAKAKEAEKQEELKKEEENKK